MKIILPLKRDTSFLLRSVAINLIFFVTALQCYAQAWVFPYPTTGTPATGVVPAGWINMAGTPDISSLTNWIGYSHNSSTGVVNPVPSPTLGVTSFLTCVPSEIVKVTDFTLAAPQVLTVYFAGFGTSITGFGAAGAEPGSTMNLIVNGATVNVPIPWDGQWHAVNYNLPAGINTMVLNPGLNDDNSRHAVSISIPVNQTGIIALPAEWIDFTARNFTNEVKLNWKTQSERNNESFVVQRSIDGLEWLDVNVIEGAGNSTSLIEYSSTDFAPLSDLSYYRLKQIDFDGEFTFSGLISVDRNAINEEKTAVYPNPTSGSITLNAKNIENQEVEIYTSLFENVTKFIQRKSISPSCVTLDLSNLPSGIYYIKTNNVFEKIVKR